jgi:hypothetical protein
MGSDSDSKIKRTAPQQLVLAVVFFVFTFLFLMVVPLSQTKHYIKMHSCEVPTIPQSLEGTIKGPNTAETIVDAIAQICIGKCDFDMLCASVRSLRTSGGWMGPIFGSY